MEKNKITDALQYGTVPLELKIKRVVNGWVVNDSLVFIDMRDLLALIKKEMSLLKEQ